MDEPFGALDAFTREQMQTLLLEVWRHSGRRIFLITHDIEEALFLATELVLMSPGPGRIVERIEPGFSRRWLAGEPVRALKSDLAFIALREHLLDTWPAIGRRMTRRPRNAFGVFSALPGVTGLSAPRWRLRLRHPLALGLFSVALLLLIWQIIAGSGWIQPLFLPAPQAVLAAGAGRQSGLYGRHAVATPGRQPVAHRPGLAGRRGGGRAAGLAMGVSPVLRGLLDPLIEGLSAGAAAAGLSAADCHLRGIGELSKVLLIFLAMLAPIVLSATHGVTRVSPSRLRAAQSLGASRRQLLWRVVLPTALPDIPTGLRIGLGAGWSTLVARGWWRPPVAWASWCSRRRNFGHRYGAGRHRGDWRHRLCAGAGLRALQQRFVPVARPAEIEYRPIFRSPIVFPPGHWRARAARSQHDPETHLPEPGAGRRSARRGPVAANQRGAAGRAARRLAATPGAVLPWQTLSPRQQRDFAARFGPLHTHPIYPQHPDAPEIMVLDTEAFDLRDNAIWHTDVTFNATPPLGAVLAARKLPEVGGDTLWASGIGGVCRAVARAANPAHRPDRHP